uniref:DNA excision repair protein ERCC-8 n=1 Tax=Meloidogyne incognita TaxID=6306 RepID=A0A914KPC4_MELIC
MTNIYTFAFQNREIGKVSRLDRLEIIDRRISTLRSSCRHAVQVTTDSGTSTMAFERIDGRFLLCGNSRGAVSIIDFESYTNYNSIAKTYPLNYKIIQTRTKNNHHHMVNGCQWYPVDTSIFVTTGMDNLLKIWDSSVFTSIEDFKFIQPVSHFHWTVSSTNASSLIAVATASSNISFIDPRIGHIPQNLRAKEQRIYSVRWISPSKYILATGSDLGKIALWDIRSGKAKLREVSSPFLSHPSPPKRRKLAHTDRITCLRASSDGRFLISMSHDQKLCLWNSNLKLLSWMKLTDFDDLPSQDALPTNFEISDEGHKLWAFIPFANDLLLINVYPSQNSSKLIPLKSDNVLRLHGHFQRVISCSYRYNYQQIVTSSNDRSILIWEPAMDNLLSDSTESQVQQIYKDAFSDDEFD